MTDGMKGINTNTDRKIDSAFTDILKKSFCGVYLQLPRPIRLRRRLLPTLPNLDFFASIGTSPQYQSLPHKWQRQSRCNE